MAALRQIDSLAKTWGERGVAVPFATPDLTRARMRRDEHGRREFILPNLSGGKGCYVMSWNTIRTMMPVAMYDRLLFDLIEKQDVDNPLTLHAVVLQATASGLAGPDATRQAREAIEAGQQYQVLTTFMLVLQLLKAKGIDGPDYLSEGLHSPPVQRYMRAALQDVAGQLGIGHDELYTRIEVLAALVAPLGLRDAVEPGRLRQMVADLAQFRDDTRAWAEQSLPEVADLAEFEARAADFVCGAAETRIAQIDERMTGFAGILADWGPRSTALAGAVRDLAWLLDGWGTLLRLYHALPAATVEDWAAAVVELYPFTPIIPSSVMNSISEQQLESLSAIQRRRVRAHTDWRTGQTDFEQVRRIETYKAAAAEPAKRP